MFYVYNVSQNTSPYHIILLLVNHWVKLINTFSAFFILFRNQATSFFSDPTEAFMGMFLMSLGEFGDVVDSFETFHYDWVP